MKKYVAIDCFCGAGGLSLGFISAGYDIVYAFDSDDVCVSTYKRNIGEHVQVRDIKQVTKSSIEKQMSIDLKDVDVVMGGPPCQGFSVQRRGDNLDERNNLVLEFVRLVLEIKPKFFVMENVGGLMSARGKPVLEELRRQCWENDYTISLDKLNAFDFGVPQIRKRVFIIGEFTRDSFASFTFPKSNRGQLKTPSTVREAIWDLMKKNDKEILNHQAGKLSPINLERIRAIKAGEGRDSLPPHLQLNCHINNPTHRHLDVYGRMDWDKPSPTITTKFDSFSRGRFGHPELDRNITPREGARLQSFPDDFIFVGNKTQITTQIGNAVPPLLAQSIAERIIESLGLKITSENGQ